MTVPLASEEVAAPGAPDLGSRVLRNTGAQIVGRGFIAISRLIVAGIIVRVFGAGTFGEYALVFGLLAFAEWLVDFGTTEVFIREVCRDPARQGQLLRILSALKLIQVPIAFLALATLVLLMHYPDHVVHAGLVGGLSLAFFAGVLVFRVIFKASLTTEREVAAEFVAALAMIPLIAVVARTGGGLVALLACHVVSRGIFLAICMAFGRSQFRLSVRGVTRKDLAWGTGISLTVGVIGLLVAIYEMLDMLLLSKLGSTVELGYYSGAQRLIWPILISLTAVGGTLYPIVARHWPGDRAAFGAACQRGVDAVLLLAGIALSSTLAAAEFFLGLLGPDLVAGAPALRILSLLVFLKAITSTLGPVLYVVHAQRHTLLFIAAAVVVKAVVIALLASRMGYLGVAAGALVVEFACAVLPTVYLLRLHGGLHLRWAVGAKVALAIAGAALATAWRLPGNGLAAALGAPIVYCLLVICTGVLRLSDVRALWRKGRS